MNDNQKMNLLFKQRPTDPKLDREIEVNIVSTRCVYVNNYRVAGSKPYISENLPQNGLKTTVRQVLDAFTEEELLAYIFERRTRNEFMRGARLFRDAGIENAS